MISYTIEVDAEDVLSYLAKVGSELKAGIEDVLDEAAEMVKDKMQGNAPVGALGGGSLRDSIDVIEKHPGERVIGPGGAEGTRSYPLPKRYAIFVEEGNSAHIPNYEDLANRTGLDLGSAIAIAKSLADKPGKAHKFVEKTFNESDDIVFRAVDSMVERATK